MKKTILITGASSGIGRDTALALARRGHRVIATARRRGFLNDLEKIASDENLDMAFAKLDITDGNDVAAAKTFDPDVLINNAGMGESGPIAEIPIERVHKNFETNVFGTLALTQAVVPGMLARKSGRIVNVSSVAGRLVVPFLGAYHMTKYAIEAMSDAQRLELEPRGIRVSMIEPGLILTGFNEEMAQTKYEWLTDASLFAEDLPKMRKHDADLPKHSYSTASIVAAMVHAVESPRPKTRYTAPKKYQWILCLAKFLPDRVKDRILRY